MEEYSHVQSGRFILSIMAAVMVLLIGLMTFAPNSVGIGVLGFLLLVAWMFSRMTIEVTEDELKWKFGPGFLKKNVPLDSIESCETIQFPRWYGYGIRLTPDGWLYNVSGKDAVLICLKSGKKFLLGTDDPQNLKNAIDQNKLKHEI